MPIRYRIFRDIEFTYTQLLGHVTLDEILSTLKGFRSDPHHRPKLTELIDMRGLRRLNFGLSGLRTTVTALNSQESGHALQVLLADSDYAYGMARQYQVVVSTQNGAWAEVYRNETMALAACGLAETGIDQMLRAHATLQ